ncbi:MAG: adenine phosphoribosyltransferase [Firmicutes bacterium]|nr:adenine phosphoribosyltransferase [Bacillota bacterium]
MDKVSEQIKSKIRAVNDFPKKGIVFRDITTALKDASTLSLIVDRLASEFTGKIDLVVAIESRGFIFGMPLAYKLGAGFVPIRKRGKLPAETYCASYDLEYGSDTIEMHKDAIEKGQTVLLVDDLLATGGTAKSACELITKAGGKLIASAFLIELTALNGKEKLKNTAPVFSLIKY